jgi:hypothetical protein
MWIVVMGLMMLTGAVVRDQGFDNLGWERAGMSAATDGAGVVTVIAGPPVGTVSMRGANDAEASMSQASESSVDGAWDLACESKRGNHLVFDRDSIREIGSTTLFRWAAAEGAPESEAAVYTAVADCRAKSIEAHWPGKRTATRAGTCGRHLVDAVCAARTH